MEITYKTQKLEKCCTDARVAEKIYGRAMAQKIQMRIDQIMAADTVEMLVQMRIGRCHALSHNRRGQYAMDLEQPYRLVFEKKGNEIQIANILEIIDYH